MPYNYVTSHVTAVYFVEVCVNYVEFKDKILIKNLWGVKEFLAQYLKKEALKFPQKS